MEDQVVRVRAYADEDAQSLGELLSAHMETDDTWPPQHARIQHNLTDWLADSSRLGRWVALLNSTLVGHVGVDSVAEGNKADHWIRELDLPRRRLAEIGRLVVHPEKRRSRVSELLTRRCVRDTVNRGYVPVATAFASATASLSMMTGLGWRVIAQTQGRRSGKMLKLLIPPQQLIDAALCQPQSPTAQFSD